MMQTRLPIGEPLTSAQGILRLPWIIYFRNQADAVANTPQQTTSPVSVAGSTASIGITPIPSDPLAPGLYRVTWYARIVTAAGVSSSLTVTISWTDGGIACSTSGAALNGNTVASAQSETRMARIDQATPISYATTYASNPAAAMAYDLVIIVEQLN
ncbi:MAG: hypothetical protein IT429_03150 [Gemmataceae bacterium]|nr:hypothetical protein [Gemmataceae bacterium]